MSDMKLIRPVNPNTLPPELTKNLRSIKTSETYTLRDLALSFTAYHGQSTLDDLLIYIFQVRNKITSRGYMYQMMHRMRREGLVKPVEKFTPHNVVYKPTSKGEDQALTYIQPDTGEV